MPEPVLAVERLSKTFAGRGGAPVKAVSDASFTLRRGETLGLVGESGCGKSTLSRLILSLMVPDGGAVRLGGDDFTHATERAKRSLRRRIQIVFQDALSSLNTRMTVAANIAEPMRLQGLGTGATRRAEAHRLLGLVGLREDHAERYPHEFSGGQCQRIAIARALILKPEIIVFDEACRPSTCRSGPRSCASSATCRRSLACPISSCRTTSASSAASATASQ